MPHLQLLDNIDITALLAPLRGEPRFQRFLTPRE